MAFLKLLFLISATHVLTSIAWSADAQEVSLRQKEMCVVQLTQRTAAMVAEDWPELERLAERYVKTCKNVVQDEDYSLAYLDMAVANVQLNYARKALSASELCINIYYSNCGCHMQKIMALIALNRLTDARATLNKAERLIEHLIDVSDRDQGNGRSASEMELLKSHRNNLSSQQRLAASIRYRYFSQ